MQLNTSRLLLREYVQDDWRAVLAYQRDPRYLRFYAWNDRTEKDVRDFLQQLIDSRHENPRKKYAFAVTLKFNGQLIGNCNLRKHRVEDLVAEIGYEIAPAHWSNGYATEAARAIVEFGFHELKLHRIAAWCIAENATSAHVLEKIGMQLEGRLREQERIKGRWCDVLLYGILDREWVKQIDNFST